LVVDFFRVLRVVLAFAMGDLLFLFELLVVGREPPPLLTHCVITTNMMQRVIFVKPFFNLI
jgi:hypothetical protein